MKHKKLNKYILLASIITILASNASYAKSISDTITQSLISNPDLHASYASELGQLSVVKEKKSSFFPVFNAEASFEAMRTKDDNTKSAVGNESEDGYGGEGRVVISQTVFDANNTLNNYRAAKNRLTASKFETKNKTLDIALSSIAAHLNVLRVRELEYNTEEYIKDLNNYIAKINEIVKGGALNESELLQAKTIKTIAENNLLNYEEQKQFAEADYLQFVGVLPSEEMTISDSDVISKNMIPNTIDDALNTIRTKHPLLQSTDFIINALGHDIKAEKSAKFPKIDAELSHFMREQKESFGGEVEDSSALVRMTWNIEIGGAQKARIMQKKQNKEEAYLNKKSIERELEKNIRQNLAKYHTSFKRLKLQDDRQQTNRKIFKSYKNQFQSGNKSILDLISSRNQLYQASIEYTNSYYDYYLAQFETLNALGILQEALNINPPNTVSSMQ